MDTQNDNTTPMTAAEYDQKINRTIPYYSEFYKQVTSVVRQCGFKQYDWLDLGCGTGTMEVLAAKTFPQARFVLADPSEEMLKQAKMKLKNGESESDSKRIESGSESDSRFEFILLLRT
ncbi:MAG: class I SAM-dependent methyltransferase [Clostridia bacterium]|nr:class I SAM-dependent methyltransferase [Clostridia bacterium]